MRRLLDAVARVADKDVTVLVRGETGTGKELVGSLLHAESRRADRPLVRFNCAAIPGELAEAERSVPLTSLRHARWWAKLNTHNHVVLDPQHDHRLRGSAATACSNSSRSPLAGYAPATGSSSRPNAQVLRPAPRRSGSAGARR